MTINEPEFMTLQAALCDSQKVLGKQHVLLLRLLEAHLRVAIAAADRWPSALASAQRLLPFYELVYPTVLLADGHSQTCITTACFLTCVHVPHTTPRVRTFRRYHTTLLGSLGMHRHQGCVRRCPEQAGGY